MIMLRKTVSVCAGDSLHLPASDGSEVSYNFTEHGEGYVDIFLPRGGWSMKHPPCQSWWCRLKRWWNS